MTKDKITQNCNNYFTLNVDKVTIKEGDLLIVKVPMRYKDDHKILTDLQTYLKTDFEVKILIVSNDIEIEVARNTRKED